MVFINGVKYACMTCIKGHRSTACQHSDRELHVIKKKGRPITQCSHCRELRKTQKVHVKCNCIERKKEELQAQSVRSAQSSLEHNNYQPTSGNKTSVESLLNPCQCLTGAKCICCRPAEQDSSNIQYSNDDLGFVMSDIIPPRNDVDNSSSYSLSPVRTPYILPPIYDNTKGKSASPSLNNNSEGFSYLQNDSNSSPLISIDSQSSQEKTYDPLEPRYLSRYDKDYKPRDQSGVLGEEICRSTSADLVNIIYSPFQHCSSANADGSCCGGDSSTMMSICRCGSGCKCEGCDTHAKRVDFENNTTFQQNNPPSSGCCSSYETTQPEHTVVRDEDGVLLCGCGCQKLDTECPDCLENLCEEYLLK